MDQEAGLESLFRGRYLVTIGTGFLLGVLLFVLLSPLWALLIIAASSFVFLLFAVPETSGKSRTLFLLFSAGLALALVLFGAECKRHEELSDHIGSDLLVTGTVSYREGSLFDLYVTEPFRGKIRVYSEDPAEKGDRISLFVSRLAFPSASAERDGVDLVGKGKEGVLVVGKEPVLSFLNTATKKVSEHFGSQREGGFLRAILLGDRSELSHSDRTAFQKTASSHLLAVSGLHISQAIGAVYCVIRVFPLSRRGRVLVFLPLISFLFLFMGGALSVFRAAVMAAFPLVGNLFYRRSDSLTSLVFAACVLVSWEPCVISDPSFVLSFSGTFAIIVSASPLCQYWQFRLQNGRKTALAKIAFSAVSAFAASFLVFLFQFPFLLLIFGEIQMFASLYGVLFIPLFGPCLLLALISAVLIPVPFLGEWSREVALFAAHWFLRFHAFAANGAPEPVEFGSWRFAIAFLLFGLFFYAFLTRRKIGFLLFVGFFAVALCLLLFCGIFAL